MQDDNEVRPGGTEGRQRRQTEESASRQEPRLWVSPLTFVQAILSGWDGGTLEPATASRVPPILRFHERLRELYITDLAETRVYDNRLRSAMEVFTSGEWLRYREVHEAMGGAFVRVRATDTGRFSGAYSGNAPINDQDQIRIPNFFKTDGAVIPADLYPPVRKYYTEAILGIFDLERLGEAPPSASIESLPLGPGEADSAARRALLGSLEAIQGQAADW